MDRLLCLNILLDDKPFDFYSPGAYFPLTGPNDWNLTTPLMDPPANYPLLDPNEATPLSMMDYPESNQLPPGQQQLENGVANTLLDDKPFDFYSPSACFPLAGANDWNLTSAHADPLAGYSYSDPKALDYFENPKRNQLFLRQSKGKAPSIRLTKASEYKRRDPATFAAPAAFTPYLIKTPVLDDDRQITTSAPALSRLPSLHHERDIRQSVPLEIEKTIRFAPTVEYSPPAPSRPSSPYRQHVEIGYSVPPKSQRVHFSCTNEYSLPPIRDRMLPSICLRDEPFPVTMLEPLESVWMKRYKAKWSERRLEVVGSSPDVQMSSTSSPGSSAEVTTSTRASASAPHDRSIPQRGFEFYPPSAILTRPQRYASTHLALLPTSSGSRRGLFSMPQEQPVPQESFWNHIIMIDENPSFMTTSEMDTDVSIDECITDVSQDNDASYSSSK